MNLQKHISPHGRVTAVSMMKDEGPYVLEWIAHHLAIGFTDILVYTNDCTDGTDDMLIRLQELGLAHHRRNDIPEGIKPQPSAMKYAQNDPIVQQSDWVLVFDADEFLVVKYGDGTLDDVLTAAGDAHAIVITWRVFGSGNVVDWSRAPVSEQYLFAAPETWNKGWGVKTLFRHDPDIWKLGIHRPKMRGHILKTDYPESIYWLNGSGRRMEDYFKYRGWRSIRRTVGYDWLQMNHYAVKGIDAYAMRKLRGNVNNKKDKYNADYWALQDRNEVRETSILRHAPKRAAIMAELLTDPVLNRLHHAALEQAEARLADYKKTDAYAQLRDGLIKAGQEPITKVVAKPPKARDPAKIAARMSAVEKRDSARPPQDARNRATMAFDPALAQTQYNAGPVQWQGDSAAPTYANHDVLIPAEPQIFTPDALTDIQAGKFDRRNARHFSALVTANDRMLNLGSGACFIPVLGCLKAPGLTVLAHETRPDLRRIAEQIAALNGLTDTSRLKIVSGDLIFAGDDSDQASGLAAYLHDFRPTVLRICDPVVTLGILSNLPLHGVQRVIHTGVDPQNAAGMAALQTALPDFAPAPGTEKTGVAVMDRSL